MPKISNNRQKKCKMWKNCKEYGKTFKNIQKYRKST